MDCIFRVEQQVGSGSRLVRAPIHNSYYIIYIHTVLNKCSSSKKYCTKIFALYNKMIGWWCSFRKIPLIMVKVIHDSWMTSSLITVTCTDNQIIVNSDMVCEHYSFMHRYFNMFQILHKTKRRQIMKWIERKQTHLNILQLLTTGLNRILFIHHLDHYFMRFFVYFSS